MARKTASTISSPQWLVLIVTGAGGFGFTISPFGAITVMGLIDPSFLATSKGAMYISDTWDRERVFA